MKYIGASYYPKENTISIQWEENAGYGTIEETPCCILTIDEAWDLAHSLLSAIQFSPRDRKIFVPLLLIVMSNMKRQKELEAFEIDRRFEKKLIAELTSAERARLAWMIRLLRRNRKLGLSEIPEEYREDCHYFTRTCYLHIRAGNMMRYHHKHSRIKKVLEADMKKYTKKEDPEPYTITSKEDEDDIASVDARFATLDAASEYIQERWQGIDYIISPTSFCTDYAIYELIGFTLNDIGRFEQDYPKNSRYFTFNHPIEIQ